MSIEDELLALARDREAETERALGGMMLERPDLLGRSLRAYLSRQADHGRMRRTKETIPQLSSLEGGISELACPEVRFSSGARLTFRIQLSEEQRGWLVNQFHFQIRLPRPSNIPMVRIHLKPRPWHDPLTVPRCHMHVGDSQCHLPFPVMNPRLILYLICEHVADGFRT